MNRTSRPRRASGVRPLLTALLAAPLFLAAPALAAEAGADSARAQIRVAALPVTGPHAPPQGIAREFAQGTVQPPPASLPAAPSAPPKAPAKAPEKAPALAKDPARIAPAPATTQAAASTDGSEDTELVLACKARALTLLRQKSPEIEDIFIDMDGLTIARAELSVGETRIHTVMMGEAYIQRDKTDKIHRFLCLTGEKSEVLLTFFTER